MNEKIEKANRWNTFRDNRAVAILNYIETKKTFVRRNKLYILFTFFRVCQQLKRLIEYNVTERKVYNKRLFIALYMSKRWKQIFRKYGKDFETREKNRMRYCLNASAYLMKEASKNKSKEIIEWFFLTSKKMTFKIKCVFESVYFM